MVYLSDSGKKCHFSYRELQAELLKVQSYTDEEFMTNLPTILHLACFVSWVKELPNSMTLADEGIIHELVHLLDPTAESSDLSELRKQFNEVLKLC